MRRRCIGLAVLSLSACAATPEHGAVAGEDIASMTGELTRSGQRIRGASAAKRPGLIDAALALAKARAAAMRKLIEHDPARALDQAMDDKTRAALPPALRDHVERHLRACGVATVEAVESSSGTRDTHYTLDSTSGAASMACATGRRHRLRFIDPPQDLASGDGLAVDGIALGDDLVVDKAQPIAGATQRTAAPRLSKTGTQQVLVILAAFEGDEEPYPYSADQATKVFFGQVDAFYAENTLGKTRLAGKVVGPLTLPYKREGCLGDSFAHHDFMRAAIAAAKADGTDTSSYAAFFVVFPRNGCFWAGRGTVGGGPAYSWINGALTVRTLAHELGHNFGLRHSHSLSCSDGVLTGKCVSYNYGNVADVMGRARSGHFNAFQKQRLGWLDGDGFGAVTTVQASGTFRIGTYEAQDTTPKALRVLRSVDLDTNRKTYYYIERRQPIGFDKGLPAGATAGVLITLGTEGNANSSHLLDMTPATPTFDDAALTPGASFVDKDAGVAIRLLSADADGAELKVEVGASCQRRAPQLVLEPASASARAGETARLTVTVSNRDSWACPATTLTLAASGDFATKLDPPTLTLTPGASASVALTVAPPRDASVGDGADVVVTASHPADATLQGQASARVVVDAPACDRRAHAWRSLPPRRRAPPARG